MLIVEFLFYHPSGISLLSYLHFHLRVKLGKFGIDECHAHTFVSRNGMIARGHLTYLSSVLHHRIVVAGHSTVGEFDAHMLAHHPFGTLME